MEERDEVWQEWLASRPEEIRAIAKSYPPGMYHLRLEDGTASETEYLLVGYTEGATPDEAPTVILRTDGLMGLFPREVFGVSVDDLIAIDTLNTRKENDDQQQS